MQRKFVDESNLSLNAGDGRKQYPLVINFGGAAAQLQSQRFRFDLVGNGWIDESDPVFNKLQVWTPDQNGGGTLARLREKQVGALFLGKQAMPFELRDGANQSLGAVRASSI